MSERSEASGISLEIEFNRPAPTYLAGEDLTGRVRVEAERQRSIRSLSIQLVCQTRGFGSPVTVVNLTVPSRALQLQAGESSEQAFSFSLPAHPLTYEHPLLSIGYSVIAQAKLFSPKAVCRVEAPVVVRSSDETCDPLPQQAPPTPDPHKGTSGGLCCAALIAGFALALGAKAITAGSQIGILGPLLALPALVLFGAAVALAIASSRNLIAERKLGPVFIGVDPVGIAGTSLSCLVGLKPRSSLKINGVLATLRGRVWTRHHRGNDTFEIKEDLLHELSATLSGPQTLSPRRLAEFETHFDLPHDAAPWFESSDNKVEWIIDVRVDVPGWPDWTLQVPVRVIPKPTPSPVPRLRAKGNNNSVCPYCRDALGSDASQHLACGGCRTLFHKVCIREFGECTTQGCRNRRRSRSRT
jgi:hypothetical protein